MFAFCVCGRGHFDIRFIENENYEKIGSNCCRNRATKQLTNKWHCLVKIGTNGPFSADIFARLSTYSRQYRELFQSRCTTRKQSSGIISICSHDVAGLLDIVVRTMALVRRNNILQEKVNALSAETRDFIHSVLNNPENKCVQQRLDASDCKDADVSSSTEKTVSRPSLPPTPDTTYSSSSNDVTSSCGSSERDTEESSFEDDES